MAERKRDSGHERAAEPRRFDVPAVLRALRRRSDLSQRELAVRARVDPAQLARLESGANDNPRLLTLQRVMTAAGARIAAVDLDGTELTRLPTDDWHDDAGRRFPPHLDARPSSRWRGIRRHDPISFIRSRPRRDQLRRDEQGRRRYALFTEYRLLGPADLDILHLLRVEAADFNLANRTPPPSPPLDQATAVRYLRDPSLRHWVAEDRGRILGYLVARLHSRHAGPPALIVTDYGLRQAHRRDETGLQLVAALCDEAALFEVRDIWAIVAPRAVAAHLRRWGFRPAPSDQRLLAA